MIKNKILFDEFEKNFIKNNKLNHNESIKLFDLMLQEWIYLNSTSSNNNLEGIEKDIEIAKILNNIHD